MLDSVELQHHQSDDPLGSSSSSSGPYIYQYMFNNSKLATLISKSSNNKNNANRGGGSCPSHDSKAVAQKHSKNTNSTTTQNKNTLHLPQNVLIGEKGSDASKDDKSGKYICSI